MAIIRRPNTNYISGTGLTIVKADNAGLDAVDVTFTLSSPNGRLVATWAGRMPTITGAGFELVIPYLNGASATWTLKSMKSRLSILPVGTTSFRTEKSAGGGAFSASPTTIATLTHTTSDYEKANTALALSVTTGDLIRIYFPAVAGSGGTFCVELEGV